MSQQKQGMLDKQWENTQRKTFGKWVQAQLRKRGGDFDIEHVDTEFSDGIKLHALLEIISGDSLPKIDMKPKMRIHKIGNINVSLKSIKEHGVKLVGISAEELCDGNLKLVLGMIWTIILRFQIQDISVEEMTAKEGLLLWCQRKTHGYRNVNVQNFHRSWNDGLAFCAIIHKHKPNLIDFDSLSKNNAKENLELAFRVAEKEIGIPRMLDPEDLTDVEKPDERSVMTYVSEFFHAFSKDSASDVAARRIQKVLNVIKSIDDFKNDYVERAKKLIEWIETTKVILAERNLDGTLKDVETKLDEFKRYKSGEKTAKSTEKTELESLFSTIQTRLRATNRAAWQAPAGLSPEDIDNHFGVLGQVEKDRDDALRAEYNRLKRLYALVNRFNNKAPKLARWADEKKGTLQSTDYGDSVASVQANIKKHESYESEYSGVTGRLNSLKKIGADICAERYENSDAINNTLAQLDAQFNELAQLANVRRDRLKEELDIQLEKQNKLLSFAKSALSFNLWVDNSIESLTEVISTNSVEEVDALIAEANATNDEQSEKNTELNTLEERAVTLRAEGLNENTYLPVSLENVKSKHASIGQLITQRSSDLAAERTKQQKNDVLRRDFADKAKAFVDWIAQQKIALTTHVPGELEQQLAAAEGYNTQIQENKPKLGELNVSWAALEAAGVTENKYTPQTIESISLLWNNLQSIAKKKIEVLNTQILEKNASKVTPEQEQEFKQSFDHFDKDKSGKLDRLELKACLQSLSQVVTDQALDSVLSKYGAADGKMPFNNFVQFMITQSSDRDSPDDIKQAFATLAGGLDYVTKEKLSPVFSQDQVAYFLSRMPPYPEVEGGYDYRKFTDDVLYGGS